MEFGTFKRSKFLLPLHASDSGSIWKVFESHFIRSGLQNMFRTAREKKKGGSLNGAECKANVKKHNRSRSHSGRTLRQLKTKKKSCLTVLIYIQCVLFGLISDSYIGESYC